MKMATARESQAGIQINFCFSTLLGLVTVSLLNCSVGPLKSNQLRAHTFSSWDVWQNRERPVLSPTVITSKF